ncbi:MAG: C_GCAxxG_C_C family protein [Selenomonadaceae bacterium]|nr:C_GCAxxG_C_C family protein [Selenomonadaceae bacterium]
MMSKAEQAVALQSSGYNCAQAVACVFDEEVGVPKEILFRATEGFGSGAGTMEGICGALSASLMIAGLKNSSASLDKPNSKTSTMKLSRQLMTEFKHDVGALICREIKGAGTGKVLCACPDCVRNGVRLTEKIVLRSEA